MITKGNAKEFDELGREVLYSSQGQQVMMQWEQQYMYQCVDALRVQRSDRVLEIGFGLAYSATRIQSFHPKRHAIIECDAAVIKEAERFASEHSSVEILCGTWQSTLPALTEQFDCVFFDDYPLPELENQGVTQNQTRTLRSRSRWHDFLDAVLPHVAIGGRITGYLARDIDLQRRGCRVEITQVRVEASENCKYFPHKTALVPVITVVDESAAAAGSTANVLHDGASPSLIPLQTSTKLLRRVIRSSDVSGPLSSPESSHVDKSQVASSRRRRFADIRECLQEQTHLDDNVESSEAISSPITESSSAEQQAMEETQNSDATKSHPSLSVDRDSRKRYLAALRQKKDAAASKVARQSVTSTSAYGAVQPQDVAEMLAAPLSVARSSYSAPASAFASSQQHQQYHDQEQRVHIKLKPTSKHAAGHKPKKASSHKPSASKQHLQQEKQYFDRHPLLVKRVWCMKAYIAELRNRPKGPKKYVPGESTMPIPVPLECGQKFRDYEQRFIEWLAKKGVTLHELYDDAQRERSYRISFAEKCVRNNLHKQTSVKPRLEVVVTADASVLSEAAAAAPKRKRDRSESPPPAMNRKRNARVVSEESDRRSEYGEPPRKIHLKRGPPSPSQSSSLSASQYTQPGLLPVPPKSTTAPDPVLATDTPTPAAETAALVAVPVQSEEAKCSAKLPGAQASNEAFVAAYVSCNCRQCMQDWNLMLTERLTALEKEMRSWREQQQLQAKPEDVKMPPVITKDEAAKQMEKGSKEKSSRDVAKSDDSDALKPEMKPLSNAGKPEETSDTEDTCSTMSGTESSSIKAEPAAAAKPTPASANGPQSSESSSSQSNYATSSAATSIGTLAGDPIKSRMVEEYNALNSQILLNENVMEDSLQRVQTTMLTDMAGAIQEHQQIQQIQQLIQSDVESRNKAVAMLIAYCWAYKQQELREQIDKLGALNITHVQGVSHSKCAEFAAQIESKHEFLASLKGMLDHIITDGSFADSGIEELSALGKQISTEEQALATLEEKRMDEFMRLFQFSIEIRSCCKTVLQGGM